MKFKRTIRYISLLMAVITVSISLCGCFDVDEMMIDFGIYEEKKNVNKKYEVLLREGKGYICTDDEAQVSVWRGDSAVFHIRLSEGYVYMGNTAGAEYDEATSTLKIDSVLGPTTIDVILGVKSELYCVDVEAPEDVTVEFVKGSRWSETPEEVTVKITYPSDYVFVEWTITGARIEYPNSHPGFTEFTFTPIEKGAVKLKANFVSASDNQ